MNMGKVGLLASAAAVAMFAASGANAAQPSDGKNKKQTQAPARADSQIVFPAPPMQMAQNFPANSNSTSPSYAELAARVQALEDAAASRDDRTAGDHARLSTLEQSFNYATWTYDNGRPVLASGDGRFTMGIRVRFQSDFAGFSQDATHPAGFAGPTDLSSGMVIRRAYFGVEGKVYSDFAYELRLNAGGSDGGNSGASGVPNGGEGDPLLNKAVVSYTGIPDFHFNVGVLEPALMMEGTTSSASLEFLERPEFENIAADSFGAGDSRRGVEIGWARTDVLWAGDNLVADVTYSGGKTGSTAGHGNGGDEQSQLLGRFSERLWTDGISNIQLGASLSHIFDSGTAAGGGSETIRFRDRPEVRVDGTRLIDTGAINAQTGDLMAFDLAGNIDNFFLGAEWSQFSVDRECGSTAVAGCGNVHAVFDHPTFSGWTVEGSWIITGESRVYSPTALNNEMGGFNMLVPSKPFSLNGDSWGAWEVVARYTDTDLNWHTTQIANNAAGILAGIAGGDERVFAIGLNWYLNRNVRLMIDDNIISVNKGTVAVAPVGNQDQDINVVGVRVQFAN
jgi:phosphate-selective porin OprO/OprP